MQTTCVPLPRRANSRGARPPAWHTDDVMALYELPFIDLLHRAQQIHRQYFDANEIQLSSLLSIKTDGCPEDCAYCPQSARYDTGVGADKLMPLDQVLTAARAAQAAGAQRFCMGAAWRSPMTPGLLYLLASVACSVTVAVLQKIARRHAIDIRQTIAANYAVTATLCWLALQPTAAQIGSAGAAITLMAS